VDYISTDFGVNSSSRFPFRARTDRQKNLQTQLIALPLVATLQCGTGKNNCVTFNFGPEVAPASRIVKHWQN